jgi:hypothetical protein
METGHRSNISVEEVECYGQARMLWERMEAERLLRWFCRTGPPKLDKWIKKMSNGTRVFYLQRDCAPLIVVQLESIRPRRAEIHFVTFRAKDLDKPRAGRMMLLYLMNKLNIEVLYGFIPSSNFKAMQYGKEVGFKVTGYLPQGSFSHADGQSECSVFVNLLRSDAHERQMQVDSKR